MRFKDAVENTPGLEQAYHPGLQALSRTDKTRHVSCKDTRILTGSINLDSTLANSLPNDSRWDYGVGVKPSGQHEKIVWIEVHPASSHHVDGVLAKLAWLKTWLQTDAPQLKALSSSPRDFVWIASRGVALPRTSPQSRKLALHGLGFPRTRIDLS